MRSIVVAAPGRAIEGYLQVRALVADPYPAFGAGAAGVHLDPLSGIGGEVGEHAPRPVVGLLQRHGLRATRDAQCCADPHRRLRQRHWTVHALVRPGLNLHLPHGWVW